MRSQRIRPVLLALLGFQALRLQSSRVEGLQGFRSFCGLRIYEPQGLEFRANRKALHKLQSVSILGLNL